MVVGGFEPIPQRMTLERTASPTRLTSFYNRHVYVEPEINRNPIQFYPEPDDIDYFFSSRVKSEDQTDF